MNTLKQQSATSPSKSSLPQIPYGYCHCGCDRKTKICPYTRTCRGLVRGQPFRFIAGHSPRHRRPPSRKVIIDGKVYCTIPLTRGMEAIVDIHNLEYLTQWLWH